MVPILRPFLALLVSQLATTLMAFVHEQGPQVAQRVAEHVTVTAQGKPWWVFVVLPVATLWSLLSGHKLLKMTPPDALPPTPVDDLEVNEALAKASGEAAAKASKGPFTPPVK